MIETGAQEKTSLSPTTKTSVAKAYAARSPTSGMAPFTIRRREPRPQEPADRYLVLRHLPFRFASSPKRMAERDADGLSLCSRARDRRPVVKTAGP